MPYVEVWVDEIECDGKCESGKEAERLRARIDEAERLLRSGYVDAALSALSDDAEVCVKRPEVIAKAYSDWKRGELPGFTNYGPPQ